jgi:hypothetical protein
LARNQVAHPPFRLSIEDVQQAFDLAKQLLELLQESLDRNDSVA